MEIEITKLQRESEHYKMENSKLMADIELDVGVADDDIRILDTEIKKHL